MGNGTTAIKWEYGGAYKAVNMEGIISLPNNSKLKVCDLTTEMPDFMKSADTLFIDPPCSQGNLKSFYTKSEKELPLKFSEFEENLFKRIAQVAPKYLFLEVFKSNKERFLERCKQMFDSVVIYDSFYYNSRKNKCWILQCTNEASNREYPELQNIDEEKVIKWICENHKYTCIGDLCMGKGLVGRYAFQAGKQFVGTELNKKRLAVLVDHIQNGTKWTIK